ncbi:MAG: NUDIX hydrolase [Bdellovibrio bacteriovorus]
MDPKTPSDPSFSDYPPIDRLSCEAIRARLRPSGCRAAPVAELDGPPPPQPLQRAAVLLTLYRHAGAWHLIFIRRAEHAADRHSGEVGFPGGRWQRSDPSCIATALREAEEEIGLPRSQVNLLGELRPLRTVSHYLVTPVVGCIPWPQALRPEPREVARIFSIPLAWLVEPQRHRREIYPAPGHPEARDLVFFDEFDGERLWGVSARIALDLIACLTRA